MAAITRLLFVALVVAAVCFANEPEVRQDSLRSDTLMLLSPVDSTASLFEKERGAWYLPLAVIVATGGLFVLLFTARSK
ncbi:MAG: hypothetical protein IPG71_05700 [bacterium]|nr:hypothetical protein [bacterium]